MELKFRQSTVGLKTPRFENMCVGVYASEDVFIEPSESKFIKTNTAFDVPEGYILLIVPCASVAEKTTLRFANSMRVVTSKEKDDVSVLAENAKPLGTKKNLVPGYIKMDGEEVEGDYRKGYHPIGTLYVQKGDLIGSGYLLKVETLSLSRAMKKQEKKNDKEEE